MMQDAIQNIQQFPWDLSVHPISNLVGQPLPPLLASGDFPTRGVVERMALPEPWTLDAHLDLVGRLALVT